MPPLFAHYLVQSTGTRQRQQSVQITAMGLLISLCDTESDTTVKSERYLPCLVFSCSSRRPSIHSFLSFVTQSCFLASARFRRSFRLLQVVCRDNYLQCIFPPPWPTTSPSRSPCWPARGLPT